jgi:O-antigen/teichoic acid export membrane protein
LSSRPRRVLGRLKKSELGGLVGDSLYVAVWQGAISVADLVQLALITHALGLDEFGRLALVLSFVVLVGQFFDLRIGAAVTTFGARRLAARDQAGFAGVIQFGFLLDAATGVVGFAVVAALAPFVGPSLIGDDGALLILLFGLTLLASTTNESSISILRLFDRFRLVALYTVGLEATRVALVGIALYLSKSLVAVVLALLVHNVAVAMVNIIAATSVFRRTTQSSLARRALDSFHERRAMLRMAIHTNVVSYARLTQVQLPTLLLGALTGPTQVGLYKVGTAAAAAVVRLVDPAYAALLPRLSRLWAAGRRDDVRALILHSTVVAAALTGVALLALTSLRAPVLQLLGGGGATAAGTVLVLVAIGQAVNGALFWNVGLLYAAGLSNRVAAIAIMSVAIQVGLLVPLAARFGANGAAASLLVSLLATNVAATIVALRVLMEPLRPHRRLEEEPPTFNLDRSADVL